MLGCGGHRDNARDAPWAWWPAIAAAPAPDGGPAWALADAYDRPVWTWDGRGFIVERQFDAADRPVAVHVSQKDVAILMEENVLAVIHNRGQWTYYFAEVDLWIMDWEAWGRSFVDAGFPHPSFDTSCRGGLVLDENSVERALKALEKFSVSEQSLRQSLRAKLPIATWEDVSHLFPVVLIDFDSKRLFSAYSETLELERYVPAGWIGLFADFYEEIPMSHRYWIDGGVDHFRAALGR
ncbi:MAG: hypothetical protein R3B06_26130 [Kofleriaceae bacterium]